jgi:molybdopterin converting factor small subunit
VTIRVGIPPVLRSIAGGKRELESNGTTLQEVLVNLARAYPQLALHLFDERGSVRRNILCIHASVAVRPGDFEAHPIQADDEVIITNALAGG